MSEPEASPSFSWAALALKALPLALLGAGALVAINLFVARAFERRAENTLPPDLGPAPAFTLVSDEGKQFSSADLAGAPWIGDFIFLRCEGQCPLMTSRMVQLSKDLPPETGIRFVSFDVDPEHDTVEGMAEYAKKHGADPVRWRFLRGERTVIRSISRDGFKLAVEDAAPDAREIDPILHSSRFVLVDAAGRWRGAYDSAEPDAMKRLREDALRLAADAKNARNTKKPR